MIPADRFTQMHEYGTTESIALFMTNLICLFSVWSIFEGHGYLLVLGAILSYFLYQRSVQYLEQKIRHGKNDSQSNLSK